MMTEIDEAFDAGKEGTPSSILDGKSVRDNEEAKRGVGKGRRAVQADVEQVLYGPIFYKGEKVSCPGIGAGEVIQIMDNRATGQRLYKIKYVLDSEFAQYFPAEEAARRRVCLVAEKDEIPKILETLMKGESRRLLPATKNPIARINKLNELLKTSTLVDKAQLIHELALQPELPESLYVTQRKLITELASNIAVIQGRSFQEMEAEIRSSLPPKQKKKKRGDGKNPVDDIEAE